MKTHRSVLLCGMAIGMESGQLQQTKIAGIGLPEKNPLRNHTHGTQLRFDAGCITAFVP